MQTQTIASSEKSPQSGNRDDHRYEAYIARLQARLIRNLQRGPLFTTDLVGLWDAYLAAFPENERQFHNCHCCRRFIETYGSLVVLSEDGHATPALWNEADAGPDELRAVVALLRAFDRARVTGVFLSSESTWGNPVTGPWRHMAVSPPTALVFTSRKLTAGQAMAEKREDFGQVSRALSEYQASTVLNALNLLKSDALYRSEKVLGQAQWLHDLQVAIEKHKGARTNIIWRFVALAPASFCHPRTSMIGTLLDDIVAGVDFAVASRKFELKMDPSRYQRPQASPSAGNIAAAEKLVEKLGIARSLERRFARIDEVVTLWKPVVPTSDAGGAKGGVFGHLQPKGAAPAPTMAAPPQTVTWEKFARVALPGAQAIELLVPSSGSFTGILTAFHDDAPPILQWDGHGGQRNPFSTYVYTRPSPASLWGLPAGAWVRVTGVCLAPWMWREGTFASFPAHHNKSATFILDGARDSGAIADHGNAIFPEDLIGDLREIRSTIEAFSKAAKIQGYEEASACGLSYAGAVVRVRDASGSLSDYRIDRWD